MDKMSAKACWMYCAGLLAGHGIDVEFLNYIDKLLEAEEQGLLLRLPCKVGDTVYSITRDFISEYVIESVRIFEHSIQFYWKCTKGIYYNVVGFSNFDIGKTVFLTEQEAQSALEKMKGE